MNAHDALMPSRRRLFRTAAAAVVYAPVRALGLAP